MSRYVLALDARLTACARRTQVGMAAAWYAFIFFLSAAPGTDVDSTAWALGLLSLEGLNALFRLSAHVGVFGIMAVLVYLALRGDLEWGPRSYWVTVAVTGLLGLGDEIHQGFVPLRHFRPFDAAVDAIGGAAVLLVVAWALQAARKRALPRGGAGAC